MTHLARCCCCFCCCCVSQALTAASLSVVSDVLAQTMTGQRPPQSPPPAARHLTDARKSGAHRIASLRVEGSRLAKPCSMRRLAALVLSFSLSVSTRRHEPDQSQSHQSAQSVHHRTADSVRWREGGVADATRGPCDDAAFRLFLTRALPFSCLRSSCALSLLCPAVLSFTTGMRFSTK